jgi:hypothetical protein
MIESLFGMFESIFGNKELRRRVKRVKKDIVTMVFIDTGDRIDIEQASSKNTFLHKGHEYVINRECWLGDICLYNSQYVEPLTIREAKKGIGEYAVSTDRFNALYNNKVLKMMMYVQEKNLLVYILIAVGAVAVLTIMNIWYSAQVLGILKEFSQVAIDQGVMLK